MGWTTIGGSQRRAERGMLALVWSLDNAVQRYAWGSRTEIATLQGRPSPTQEPEAELWMGAHPRASSRLRGAAVPSLYDAIGRDPVSMLGEAVVDRFGPRLPFLLKVLAAAEPLSLQAHPDAEQAREGFDREQRAGIELDAPHRSYRDPFDKPELVCALGPFAALCGFRPAAELVRLVDALRVPSLRRLCEPLWAGPSGPGAVATVEAMLTLADPRATIDPVVAACRELTGTAGPWRADASWIVRLHERYPADAGVLVAVLLQRFELAAGEALFLGPGRLHCYLGGTAIEIMGSSDNVLRGGLTPKHVDVPELLRVLQPDATPTTITRPRIADDGEAVYETPSPAFRLSSRRLAAGERWSVSVRGPEIILCVGGRIDLFDGPELRCTLAPGGSAFVPGSRDRYVVRTEIPSHVFRATVGALR